jgi:putative transposase
VAAQSRERPFSQRRYYDFNLHGEKKLIEKRRYIHRNPVTRGSVAQPDEWDSDLPRPAKRLSDILNAEYSIP